jgi:hypothetical protein
VIRRLAYTGLGAALVAAFAVWAQQSGSGLPGGAVNTTQVKLNGTSFGGVGPGAAGEVLTSNGAGMLPSYQPAAGGGCSPAGDEFDVLLDDGAGGCTSLGVGASGEVLTSAGAGMSPAWTAAPGIVSGSFSATFNDGFTTDPSFTFDYYIINTLATIMFRGNSNLGGTSDSAQFGTTGTPVPVGLRPSGLRQSGPIMVGTNNGVAESGICMRIDNLGNITMIRAGNTVGGATNVCGSAGTWTASGSKNIAAQTSPHGFTYNLN